MVGRGWWLLVLTVCVCWMVSFVCGGSFCKQGREFYNTQDGQCMPCTRCQDPLVVVVPCYVFQDAVCAPAINFFPNLSQHIDPQVPITLSTPASVQNANRDSHHPHERQTGVLGENSKVSNSKKVFTHHHGKDRVRSYKHQGNFSNGSDSSVSLFEKPQRAHSKHHHRHKHDREHSSHKSRNDKSAAAATVTNPEIDGDVSQRNGAKKSVVGLSDNELFHVNISSDGANSDKDPINDFSEPQRNQWLNIFFVITVVVISVCVIVLLCIILSQLRSVFIRRKLKRVCDGAPAENNNEIAVMAQLLPAESSATRSVGAFNSMRSTNRCTSRLPATSASIPSSPTTTSRGRIVVESEHISGQMYTPIPFRMDRLLEQRRVLGPATSVDTNLYIESWQQADSQPPTHRTPSANSVAVTHVASLSESVSASPSPVPLRTYRLGPASASASPVIAVRGLGARVAVRGVMMTPTYPPPSNSREVVLNSRT